MKRITLTYRGKEIVSEKFSMGAYRAMYNKLSQSKPSTGLLDAAAHEAVVFMFEGTEITEDILRYSPDIDSGEIVAAYEKALLWFYAVKIKSGEIRMVGTPPDDPILCVYKKLLLNSGVLPDELDRQDPQLFFDVWCADEGEMHSVDNLTEAQRFFYGL